MMCSTGFEYDLNISKDTVGGRLVSLYSVNRGMPGLVTPVQSPSDDSSKFKLYWACRNCFFFLNYVMNPNLPIPFHF